MHVLFVHDNHGLGGVSNVSHQLASGLARRGWTVEHLDLSAGITRRAAAQVRQVARRRGIVLATNNFSAAYAAAVIGALSRRPWVMWVHGPVLEVLEMARTRPMKRRFLARVYRSAPSVVFSSAATRRSFVEFCTPAATQRQEIIRNAAASSFLAPAPGGTASQSAYVDIGYVGRLAPEKQPLQLVRMLDFLPSNYRLLVVGDGPLRDEMASAGAARVAEGRLVFLGPQLASVQTYRQWRATLLCSAYEGYPLTLLESLASGVPVVSTPIPAVTEMVARHAPYMLARDPTPQALADAVTSTVNRDADELARDVARINEAHTPARFIEQWHSFLSGIVER